MRYRYQILQDDSLEEFVKFWAEAYNYSAGDSLYTKNIGQPLTEEGIKELFFWKNGGKLSKLKAKSVNDNFVSSISKLRTFPKDTPPDQWLNVFKAGGAIWRIFFLHIWNPKYPIFDQHVFRAMKFIQTGEVLEIPSLDPKKVEFYLEKYLPFYFELEKEMKNPNPRNLDRALWKFGQILKRIKPPVKFE